MTGWDAFWGWLGWLWDSPWGVVIRVVLILLAALLVKAVLSALIRRTVRRIVRGVRAFDAAAAKRRRDDEPESPIPEVRRVQRTQSLGRIFDNTVTTAVVIVAALLVVYTVWPAATTAFALIAAGVGAGIGLGAQGVVKDVINGVFFAAEDQLGIGDVVDVGATTGIVEDLGVRITKVRDVGGTLWFVPNGQILRVGNLSHGWARAVVDLSVPYLTDVDAAREAITAAGAALAAEPAWKDRVLETPQVWGIESISSDAIVLRVVVRTRTQAKDDVARELRSRIKAALDTAGILPAPITVVRMDGNANG